MTRLGDYTNIKTGKLDANASSDKGIYPFFTCSKEPLTIDTYSYDCECVLVAGNGDLNVKYYSGKFDAYQRTYIIESKNKDKLLVRYLYCFLDKYVETLREQSIGGVIKYIKLGNLTEAEIPLPPLEEQRKIAAVLDKVSDLIAKRRQQLEKLDLLVKARFVEMFGDIDKLNVNWHSEHFKDITVCFDSFRKPVKASDRKLMQGQYPYYGATGIVDYVNDYKLDGEYLLISEDGKSLEFRNKPIAFIAKGKIWVNNHAHVVQCKEKANITYLMFHINYMDISRWVTGIDQKKLNKENLDSIFIAIPPIELQNQFSDFVQQTEKTITSIKKSLIKLETLKKALMQEYFG